MLNEQLAGYKTSMQAAQAERDKIIDQGRRAFKMMIERRDNPLNSPSARALWEKGYDLEREKWALTQKVRA